MSDMNHLVTAKTFDMLCRLIVTIDKGIGEQFYA
jgi:hypothetical protein